MHPDQAVADGFGEDAGGALGSVLIFRAQPGQALPFITDQMAAAEFILIDQFYRVRGFHQRIALCMVQKDGTKIFHKIFSSFRSFLPL